MLIDQQNVRINLSSGSSPDDIPAEAEAEYCCIHLHDREPDELGSPVESVVWVDLSTPSDDVEVDIGLTPGGVGNTAEVLAEAEGTTVDLLADAAAALESVEFSRPTSFEEGLVLPTPTSEGEELAVWVRLTINAGTVKQLTEHCLIVFAGTVTYTPAGIASAEAHGTPTRVPGAVSRVLTGIASGEALGTPTRLATITRVATGIGSAEAHGTPARTVGGVSRVLTGIASSEAHGSPTGALS